MSNPEVKKFQRHVYFKYPDSIVAFGIDWQDYIDNENLTNFSFSWEVPNPLTLHSNVVNTSTGRTIAYAWIGGGVPETKYSIKCIIEDQDTPLRDERYIDVWVKLV